mmetsp:Transcript_76469/g.171080  ORF Transcript_76469/g.171080 Transcript_76469/m.171080 type:complete len:222 (+) Transcript_76469:395-1060(+)
MACPMDPRRCKLGVGALSRGLAQVGLFLPFELMVLFRALCRDGNTIWLISLILPSRLASSVQVGRHMNWRKPTCELGSWKPSRSQRGETLRPMDFSWSPCAWNSWTTRRDHSWCRCQSFAECPMSAARKSINKHVCWSLSSEAGSNEVEPSLRRKAERSSRCFAGSVPRIRVIMRLRAFCRWSAGKPEKSFVLFSSDSPMTVSKSFMSVAEWKFSRMLRSL